MLLFAATAALCLPEDPHLGTWKPAQLDKWKISSGGRSEERKSQLAITELIGKDTYREMTTTLDSKPVESQPLLTYVLDGQEHKIRNDVTIKFERISERHIRETQTGPKGTTVEDGVVSPDGKTATITRKGTGTTSGRQVDELFIYEKH